MFLNSSTDSVVNSYIDNWPPRCRQYKKTRTQIFYDKRW